MPASAASLAAIGTTSAKQAAISNNPAHRKLVQRRSNDKEQGKEQDASQLLVTNATGTLMDKGKARQMEAALDGELEGEMLEGEWLSKDGETTAASMEMAELSRKYPEDAVHSNAGYASQTTPLGNTILLTGDRSGSHSSQASTSSLPSSSSASASSSSSSTARTKDKSHGSASAGDMSFLPFVPLETVTIPHIRHPFNTNSFVTTLERTGEFNRNTAEEIMRATKALLTLAEDRAGRDLVAKADLENEAYLFSAALAELRTEVQMTSRTDSIALRSLNSQLQREVDSLSQKMREDMNSLKNDNQLDLNTRKEEGSQDISLMEQRILELNSKFTLLLGDTRAALEANKWVQTRRSIGLWPSHY